ncbi:glycine zipper domain-containing protein [Verrucomicrobiota bacterium sgz303538]
MNKLVPAVSLGLVAAFSFSGCETPGRTALAGAATGAAIGGLATGRGRGALVGAAIGAGTGYFAGKIAQERRGGPYYDPYSDSYYYERPRGYYGRPVYYRDTRYRRDYYPYAYY